MSYYLSAYNLKNGKPRWRTLICSSQLEVNMFGNARIEYAATPVAMHEGTLYGTTNLGLNYAADAATGRVKWCSTYPVIPLPRTRLRGAPAAEARHQRRTPPGRGADRAYPRYVARGLRSVPGPI